MLAEMFQDYTLIWLYALKAFYSGAFCLIMYHIRVDGRRAKRKTESRMLSNLISAQKLLSIKLFYYFK